ncbi:MAG: GyrI-like domain-containing protein [Pseudomonadota bacterium]
MPQPYLSDYPAQPYLATRHEATLDTLPTTIRTALDALAQHLEARDAIVLGAPFVRYRLVDMEAYLQFEVGYPVDDPGSLADDTYLAGETPAGRYAVYEHQGPPATLVRANRTLAGWGAKSQVEWAMASSGTAETWEGRFEHQLIGPEEDADEDRWLVRLAYLCR